MFASLNFYTIKFLYHKISSHKISRVKILKRTRNKDSGIVFNCGKLKLQLTRAT